MGSAPIGDPREPQGPSPMKAREQTVSVEGEADSHQTRTCRALVLAAGLRTVRRNVCSSSRLTGGVSVSAASPTSCALTVLPDDPANRGRFLSCVWCFQGLICNPAPSPGPGSLLGRGECRQVPFCPSARRQPLLNQVHLAPAQSKYRVPPPRPRSLLTTSRCVLVIIL